MSQQYLLPCECGNSNVVSTAQAGRTVICICGSESRIPSLAGLRQLEPANRPDLKAATPSKRSLNRVGLVVMATVLTAASIASLTFWLRPRTHHEIPVIDLEGADVDVAEAVQEARKAVESAPGSAQAWGNLAMVLHGHALDNAAVECYSAAAELDANDPNWPYLEGYLHHIGAGGPEAAIPLFERASRLSRPNSMARLRLADMLLAQGRLDDAEREYRQVLNADPQEPLAIYGLAALAASRGEDHECLELLKPFSANPLVQKQACTLMASALDRLGDRASADRLRQRVATLPDDAPRSDDPMLQVGQRQVGIAMRLRRATQLKQQGQVRECAEELRQAVARFPDADEAWANLGMALHHLKDPTGAEQAMRKSISLSPKSATYRFNLGMFQLAQQRNEDAAETFRETLQLQPTLGPAHFGLGESLERQGDFAGARDAFLKAIQFMPEHAEARQRLELIKDKS